MLCRIRARDVCPECSDEVVTARMLGNRRSNNIEPPTTDRSRASGLATMTVMHGIVVCADPGRRGSDIWTVKLF
jgi:hypothetical protein